MYSHTSVRKDLQSNVFRIYVETQLHSEIDCSVLYSFTHTQTGIKMSSSLKWSLVLYTLTACVNQMLPEMVCVTGF